LGHKFWSPDGEISPLGGRCPLNNYLTLQGEAFCSLGAARLLFGRFVQRDVLDFLYKNRRCSLFNLMLRHTCHVSVEKTELLKLEQGYYFRVAFKHNSGARAIQLSASITTSVV
jgi:hypothetical protein